MDCLVLAAGYATRLYPLTESFPKPLLSVGDKTILDWLLEDIDASASVDRYVIVSNHKFVSQFRDWTAAHTWSAVVLDDGSSTNETRLGAVRDIQFAIESLGLNRDLLVLAGDNLLDFSLKGFVRYAETIGTTCVMRYWEPDRNKLRKTGVADVDSDGRVVSMEEKPETPKNNWCIPPFYYFRAADLPLIKKGLDSGCGIDAPGSIIDWLAGQTAVHAYEMPGKRYDIGTLENYYEIQKTYRTRV